MGLMALFSSPNNSSRSLDTRTPSSTPSPTGPLSPASAYGFRYQAPDPAILLGLSLVAPAVNVEALESSSATPAIANNSRPKGRSLFKSKSVMGLSSSKPQASLPNAWSYAATNPAILEVPQNATASWGAPEELDNEFGMRYATTSANVVVTHQRTPRRAPELAQECTICVNTKSIMDFPILSVSSLCTHAPSACLECVATSIRTDFTSKRWNQIHCPECHAQMEYQDIERYADKATLEKYQMMAFRGAVGEAPDFVWCPRNCGSGQVHEAGPDRPIVRCVNCTHRFCFKHQVAWHEQLSCDEYDAFLADPVGFKGRVERENEEAENERAAETQRRREQEDSDRRFAESLLEADQAEEARRQAEIERKERERQEAAERAQREARKRAQDQKQENMRKEAARKKAEEEKSKAFVQKNTKPCPSCSWNIEKNGGCAHMTCIKCRYEFCWGCLARYGTHNAGCTR